MTASRAYLDCNASERLRACARDAFLAALDCDGNPSSVHADGRRARSIVESAREEVAALVNARVSEVVFTSGASEANAAVLSAGWQRILFSAIEHPSVISPAEASGAQLVRVGASADGVADAGALAAGLLSSAPASRPAPALVTLQMANNETGVLQPVAETAAFARDHGAFIHVDAVQAAGRVPIDFAALRVDTLALSSHKIGGPMGAGALIVRDGLDIPPLISGGGQERGRRSGTENVPAIAGFGAAARAIAGGMTEEIARIAAMRDRLERELMAMTPEVIVVGSDAPRLPNTSCLVLPGSRAETLVIRLDLAGIAVSAGAACSSGKVGLSHVLTAMGLAAELARGALRVSLGHGTRDNDIEAFLAAWREIAGTTGNAVTVGAGKRADVERV